MSLLQIIDPLVNIVTGYLPYYEVHDLRAVCTQIKDAIDCYYCVASRPRMIVDHPLCKEVSTVHSFTYLGAKYYITWNHIFDEEMKVVTEFNEITTCGSHTCIPGKKGATRTIRANTAESITIRPKIGVYRDNLGDIYQLEANYSTSYSEINYMYMHYYNDLQCDNMSPVMLNDYNGLFILLSGQEDESSFCYVCVNSNGIPLLILPDKVIKNTYDDEEHEMTPSWVFGLF